MRSLCPSFFFFSSRRRHTRFDCDWSSDVCSSDLFDEAEAAYAEAGEMASAAGDRYSALLARIGLANTILGRGNLAEAAARLRGILADARAAGERDVEARAPHGIGVALQLMGQSPDAIPHTRHA